MDSSDIVLICERFASNNPYPKIELDYKNNYTLLVAIMLSAQTTDKNVNKATKILFEFVSRPEDMLALGKERLIGYIRSIGLFNTKAKNLMAMSAILVEQFNGQVPSDFNDLINLPGVGRKTANVFLNVAFGEKRIGVDRHVTRVTIRLGLAKNAADVEKILLQIIPEHFVTRIHHWLVLHGRYVCLASRPKCRECIIRDLCPSAIDV